MQLTWDHELFVKLAAENLLGDELEALHGVLDYFIVPLFVQAKLVDQEFLEDPIQECTSANPARAHCRLLDLQDGL